MKRSAWLAGLAFVALVWTAQSANAQGVCAGDCDGSGMVTINELIICVNIALGSAQVSACTACDVNGDGSVEINELIQAVNSDLCGCAGCVAGPTPTPGGAGFCGDGQVNVAGEECDDGNNVGGDGCAANCTNETDRMTQLDPAKSISTVQLQSLPIVLHLTGTQGLTGGKVRNDAVFGPGGQQLFAPGEMPVVVKAADVKFDPVVIAGLACACVRAIPVPQYGPGNSGTGKVGCGPDGLTDVSFKVEEDHDTSPGSPGNSGPASGLPDDPNCSATFDLGAGVISNACLEGVGAACTGTDHPHTAAAQGVAACNSPRVITYSGGPGGRGSVLLSNSTQIGTLRNAAQAACTATKMPDGSCSAPDFGPDCLACTDDDLQMGTQSISPTTSGSASVIIYDANDIAGKTIGDGVTCGGGAHPPACVAKVTGLAADCDAIMNDPNAPLSGALVTAFPNIDAAMVGDSAVTTTLEGMQ
jgi:cysteine-rich repeat protein